jgi:hypothetical protein
VRVQQAIEEAAEAGRANSWMRLLSLPLQEVEAIVLQSDISKAPTKFLQAVLERDNNEVE